MTQELTNEEIIERINAWQNAGFVHPLTCLYSKHGKMIPIIEHGKVILKCNKCRWTQDKIPPSILTVSPKQIDDEKKRLTENWF